MANYLSPIGNDQFVDTNGSPLSGGLLFTYSAGSSTKKTTYKDQAGNTAHANPIVLDSSGRPTSPIWLIGSSTYKFVLAPFNDTDPPASASYTWDNISGVNDASISIDEWVSGAAPTYVSATQFTVVGDQTSTFQVGRRVKCTVSAGTVYGRISVSAYTTLTTVTVVLDSGTLDAGLSAVALGLATVTNPSIDVLAVKRGVSTDTTQTISGDKTFSGTANVFSAAPSFSGTPLVKNLVTGICNGRLTLTTGTAVTVADVTGTTLYFTPYQGNRISLFDGTSTWSLYSFTELSIAVPATTVTMYDVFVYDNSGTPTLELTAWTNDSTRATAITLQNGVYVKSGATTRRYVGSIRTNSVSGQTEDSFAKRFVWNYYNRVPRAMRVLEATNTWNYTTASFRQANGSAANQLDFIVGVEESMVEASVLSAARNGTGNVKWTVGIGLDSDVALATGCLNSPSECAAANVTFPTSALWVGYTGIGRHRLSWLEYSQAVGTTTWQGDEGGSIYQAGISGTLMS